MSTRIGVGLDNSIDGYRCGQQALGMALSGLSTPSLALLFTSHPQPGQVLRGVSDGLGNVPLIGATSAGEYTRERYVQRGAGILLIQSDQIKLYPLKQPRRWLGKGSLIEPLHGLAETGSSPLSEQRLLLLFADDASTNLDTLVESAIIESDRQYDILGGCALTSEDPPRTPDVFHGKRIIHQGLSGAEVLSTQPLGLGLANGWTATSEICRVTEVDRHRLVTIDDRSAISVYEEFLRTQGVDEPLSRMPLETFLRYPVGLGKTNDPKVCVVTGFDAEGALIMTTPPSKESSICFLSTRPDAMYTAAQRAIQIALGDLQGPPAGLLLLDCMSNALILGDAYAQQRAAVKQIVGDVPYLGVRTHGILVGIPGQHSGHYEGSVGACLFPL